MELNKLKKIVGKKSKIIGRGYGSGKGGHTVGRGQKGARSRSGFKEFKRWLNNSNIESLPKLRGVGRRSASRGYTKSKVERIVMNVDDLNKFQNDEVITKEVIKKTIGKGESLRKLSIKILGEGELKKKLILKGLKVSESAKEKIVKAGGKVI